jgi:hypothetical protein
MPSEPPNTAYPIDAKGSRVSDPSDIDMQDYMEDHFAGAFNPLPLDRTLAIQTQTAGLLNTKTRELQELQALAQQRLARSRARLAEGYQEAKEEKRVS